jgi:hypothetical protein
MTLPTLLIILALVGSAVLMAQYRPVIFPLIALIVSGFEALMSFHLVQLSVARVPLALVFGIALTFAGVAVHIKATTKISVSAATIIAIVGALQTLSALHFL